MFVFSFQAYLPFLRLIQEICQRYRFNLLHCANVRNLWRLKMRKELWFFAKRQGCVVRFVDPCAHWIFGSPGILQSRQAGCTAGRWLGQRWWGRSSWSARFRSLASCPPGSVSRSTFCQCWFSKLLNIYMEFDVDVEFTCNSLTTVRKGPGIGNSARHTPRWCCTPYPAQRHHHHHQ